VSAYEGRHAELYDLIYADKPYAAEAQFVHELLQEMSIGKTHKVLELACGTGSHAVMLERLGYDILGTDDSEDMLAVARLKAERAGSRIKFIRQDMRACDLAPAAFDSVICLFDSIGYVRTNDAVLQAFRGANRSLREDGLLVFEFWHAGAMLRSYEPLRVRRWSAADREIVRITETTLACAQQLCHVSYDIVELKNDGSYSRIQETHINRYFLVQEMKLLLGLGSFEPLKFFAGFSRDENVDEGTWHIVAAARKINSRSSDQA
jgi:SAM-dependent methyltransferase